MLGGRLPAASASSSLDADDTLAGSKEKQSAQTTASLTGAGVTTVWGFGWEGLSSLDRVQRGHFPHTRHSQGAQQSTETSEAERGGKEGKGRQLQECG